MYTAEKVNVGVRELWPSWRGAGSCRASPGQAGKDLAIGAHPTSPAREQDSLPGMGMAKAGQDIIPWGDSRARGQAGLHSGRSGDSIPWGRT